MTLALRRAGLDDYDVTQGGEINRAHLSHEPRPRALALDDQVVGAAAWPKRRPYQHPRRSDGRIPREVGCTGMIPSQGGVPGVERSNEEAGGVFRGEPSQ
jgi:hypothetical protein